MRKESSAESGAGRERSIMSPLAIIEVGGHSDNDDGVGSLFIV